MKLYSIIAAVVLLAGSAQAHTSLIEPASREGGMQIIEDPNNKIGCGKPGPGPVTQVSRGQKINVRYYRNNHVGGFVRWAIIRRGEPETKDNFDKGKFLYTCREVGSQCYPRNGRPYSLWKDAADGVDVFQIICGDYITIPDYLSDGDYVLQFTNFGTGHSYGNPGQSTPTYRSCADLRVRGGKKKGKRPRCPKFQGGDRATYNTGLPPDQCAYFHDNFVPGSMFVERDINKVDKNYKLGRPAVVNKCNGVRSLPDDTNSTESYTFARP